jgi:hypothetical protein
MNKNVGCCGIVTAKKKKATVPLETSYFKSWAQFHEQCLF